MLQISAHTTSQKHLFSFKSELLLFKKPGAQASAKYNGGQVAMNSYGK